MPPFVSATSDLALHAPRVLGFAPAARIAARYELEPDTVEELLLDFEANGWVVPTSFGGSSGWSVTPAGRREDERRLAAELEQAGARATVLAAHETFIPLNDRFTRACTDWQIRPAIGEPLALNDHSEWKWDERVLRELRSVARGLPAVTDPLAARLHRFDGYATRYARALAEVDSGHRQWVDAPELDSCHTVWIQLHEDLLATLGLDRATGSAVASSTTP